MAAAYAALLSVMHIIDQIEKHPSPPITFNKNQFESLTQNVIFFQEFLESYPYVSENEGDGGLESRILDAANKAEDYIESHVAASPNLHQVTFGQRLQQLIRVAACIDIGSPNLHQVTFGQRLQQLIEEMDLIRNEAMDAKEKMRVKHQPQTKSTSSSGGRTSPPRNSASSPTEKKRNTTMVGFDDSLIEMLDKLTGGGRNRRIIPIIGMGGMGKTTLAKNVYEHPHIREKFDIHAWVTVSQEYDAKTILSQILSQEYDKGKLSETDEKQIGEGLHKYLFGRKYLIVMDDMWSIEAWDKIKSFFPDNNNGSRIMVTTRLSNLGRQLSDSCGLDMRFLDFDESWDLFSKIVFPKDVYPLEMVGIGKKIVRNCRGLPLSLTVMGGFLAKSKCSRETWECIEENMNSFINSDNDEHCLKILQLSYNQLPVYLKPCFLYMGFFDEDCEIRISKLVKLWVAEGFVKPINGKHLEEAAVSYLNDLGDRNLVLFVERERKKYVKIHDLLRDLCLRQAQAERFFSVVTQRTVTIPQNQRRFAVREQTVDDEVFRALASVSGTRSVLTNDVEMYISPSHKLLRIYGVSDHKFRCMHYFKKNHLQLVNLRYLRGQVAGLSDWSKFAKSLHLFWSLQTLVIDCEADKAVTAPTAIWKMPQLRHVQVQTYIKLRDPPVRNEQDYIVLENLQTLARVENFRCTEEVVKRIPNIKRLSLFYDEKFSKSSLGNLGRLQKLESFDCIRYLPERDDRFLQELSFPLSLKKLSMHLSRRDKWEDILEKIGLLPHLQVLEFEFGSFRTNMWKTVEGQFRSLKFLKIGYCSDLHYWITECSHFPRLEHISLSELHNLNEIPLSIGEMATLQFIDLFRVSKSVVISCKMIQEKHEELYGEDALHVRLRGCMDEGLEDLAGANFQFVE